MERNVLVAMNRSEASTELLEYAFQEYPQARVLVVYVTESDDPLGIFGTSDPADYMVVECGYGIEEELLPPEGPFARGQRRRAERVLNRACDLAEEYDREIEPIVRSGNTAEEIAACAAGREVDRVVLTARHRPVVGSVNRSLPETVSLYTDVPVTVVDPSSGSQPSTTSDNAQSGFSKRGSPTSLIVRFRQLARELSL